MRPYGVVLAVLSALNSCGCGSGGSAAPTSPTPSAPLTNPGSPVSQSGCVATYSCANVALDGAPNPNFPTIERITLSNGTSPSCRAPYPRNTGSNGMVPIEFTIRNPQLGNGWFWASQSPGESGRVGITPGNGQASTAGPFQVVGGFSDVGTPLRTGVEFTVVLTLITMQIPASGGPPVARSACSVQVFGNVPPS